ncbi:hypothetical protein PSE_0239 [Pseudovibrio sp. FO-BEG1]|nr:hypothetical protein PSE_0239 [Pseudovibrio sp. FO-BEG1]
MWDASFQWLAHWESAGCLCISALPQKLMLLGSIRRIAAKGLVFGGSKLAISPNGE